MDIAVKALCVNEALYVGELSWFLDAACAAVEAAVATVLIYFLAGSINPTRTFPGTINCRKIWHVVNAKDIYVSDRVETCQ